MLLLVQGNASPALHLHHFHNNCSPLPPVQHPNPEPREEAIGRRGGRMASGLLAISERLSGWLAGALRV